MNIPDFSELYKNLVRSNWQEGENLYQKVLIPWQDKADQAMKHLKVYGNIEAKTWQCEGKKDLCDLYALSRVSDILLLPFQSGSHDIKCVPQISLQERSEFFIRLGMQPIEQATFHPFYHEVVEVVQSPDPSEPISLVEIIWPGFMLGSMMFCRAGVKVCGGTNYINKETAENSVLYFTYRRRNRPTKDLSMGWGSNSQWSTDFRRDYQDDLAFYYNVDGSDDILFPKPKDDPDPEEEEKRLRQAERIELLVNRCFVVTHELHHEPYSELLPTTAVEQWPYHDSYIEPKTTWSLTKHGKLTPEQEALIPMYREKWRKVTLSTEPIDISKATKAIAAFYHSMNIEFIVCDSPIEALNYLSSSLKQEDTPYLEVLHNRETTRTTQTRKIRGSNSSVTSSTQCHQRKKEVVYDKMSRFLAPLYQQLEIELCELLREQLNIQPSNPNRLLWNQLKSQLVSEMRIELDGEFKINFSYDILQIKCVHPESFISEISFCDFCISVLGCAHDRRVWNELQLLFKECGWIYLFKDFEDTALVCLRPLKLSYDSENRLHAEGEPAIQFADRFGVYMYHGVTLPRKYGEVHSSQWQTQWLLKEEDTELRQVLIEGIGYERLCQELPVIELDSWQEYTLLGIDNNYDYSDTIYLLRMTCPSTGRVSILWVSPDVNSAREAVYWASELGNQARGIGTTNSQR